MRKYFVKEICTQTKQNTLNVAVRFTSMLFIWFRKPWKYCAQRTFYYQVEYCCFLKDLEELKCCVCLLGQCHNDFCFQTKLSYISFYEISLLTVKFDRQTIYDFALYSTVLENLIFLHFIRSQAFFLYALFCYKLWIRALSAAATKLKVGFKRSNISCCSIESILVWCKQWEFKF